MQYGCSSLSPCLSAWSSVPKGLQHDWCIVTAHRSAQQSTSAPQQAEHK